MIIATHSPTGVITTEITVRDATQNLVITVEGVTTASMPSLQIETREVALRGEPGVPGDAAQVSDDPNNRLEVGTDGKLYVSDDLIPDPLAHYLLQRGIL